MRFATKDGKTRVLAIKVSTGVKLIEIAAFLDTDDPELISALKGNPGFTTVGAAPIKDETETIEFKEVKNAQNVVVAQEVTAVTKAGRKKIAVD